MSLNWKEIDLVLSELDLEGAQVQKITQPAYDTLVLSLYKSGRATELLFCVAHGACRVHETRIPVPKSDKPQRFMELLRAQVRGARVVSISQLPGQRIVRLVLGSGERERVLWARLWSGAANIILTEPDGRIVDALTRKPKKGEMAGGRYMPQEEPLPERQFSVRELVGPGSFNERIDAYYAEHGSELSRQALLARAEKHFAQKSVSLHARIASLEKAVADSSGAERYRELGDMLMACQHLDAAAGNVETDDFYRGGRLSIRVDPKKSVLENAQDYYERSRKAKSGAKESELELAEARAELSRLDCERDRILAEENPHAIRAFLMRNRTSSAEAPKRYPGLSLEVDGWTILIGRSAAENDQLLRRHVRGSDTWLHARDYSGSYVFIKAKAGKSIPLPLLLDAGMLAVYYSKARNQSAADLYYTQAKNLKRVKGGPKGLVIPQNEKNLRVAVDDKRLRELRRLIGIETE